jgi:formate C-acetyltransferase
MNPAPLLQTPPANVNPSPFKSGAWQHHIDVRDFIQANFAPYTGDERFLAPTTERTQKLWAR